MATKKTKERLSPIPRPGKRREPVPQADRDGSGFSAAAEASGPNLDHIAADLRPLARPLVEIAFMVGNAVKHPEKQIEDIKASLRTFGQVEPLILNRRSTPPEVIGGNGRLAAMLSLGWTHAAVVVVDLPREKANMLSVALNRTADGREWDHEALGKLLAEVKADDAAALLLEDPGLEAMFQQLEKEFAPKEEKKPDADPDGNTTDQADPEKLGVLVECRDTGHQQEVLTALAEIGQTGRAIGFTEKLIQRKAA